MRGHAGQKAAISASVEVNPAPDQPRIVPGSQLTDVASSSANAVMWIEASAKGYLRRRDQGQDSSR